MGKRENCQINDIHTQRKRDFPPPQTNPAPPQMSLCELPSTGGGGGKIKTIKTTFQTPGDVGGKGERRGSKWTSRIALLLGQHPSPWDEMLGSGPGAQTPTHHTHEARTHLPLHTHIPHTCTHTPVCICVLDTQGHKQHTHSPRHTHTQVTIALTHIPLKAAERGAGEGGEVAWSLPSQRPPPQYVPETPTPAPSSTQVHGAQYCLGARCVTAKAGAPPPQVERRDNPGPHPGRGQGQAWGAAGGKAGWKEALVRHGAWGWEG